MLTKKQIRQARRMPDLPPERVREIMQSFQPPLAKCEEIDEDTCRALVCPRHRKRLAYCPWAKNGRVSR